MKVRCNTFEPSGDSASEKVGIALLNHIGSSVTQDAGRDAQMLADTFGLAVIGADRPGSGKLLPSLGLAACLKHFYLPLMAPVALAISKEADALGIKRLLVAGRSAGGLGALAVARTELVGQTSHLYAAEPPGWYELSDEEGRQVYTTYRYYETAYLDNRAAYPGLIRPQPSGIKGISALRRRITMLPHFLNDQRHNAALILSDASRQYALHAARSLPSVETTIRFATHSLVLPHTDGYLNNEIAYFNDERPTTSAPFDIGVTAEHTVHRSFDNRDFMAHQLSPIVGRLIASVN